MRTKWEKVLETGRRRDGGVRGEGKNPRLKYSLFPGEGVRKAPARLFYSNLFVKVVESNDTRAHTIGSQCPS